MVSQEYKEVLLILEHMNTATVFCILKIKMKSTIFLQINQGLNVVCDLFIKSGTEIQLQIWIALVRLQNERLLWIEQSNNISNLSGLENLSEIEGFFRLKENPGLSSIDELSNLTTIGQSCSIISNPNLLSVNGFEDLAEIGRDLTMDNDTLSSLEGLENLPQLGT